MASHLVHWSVINDGPIEGYHCRFQFEARLGFSFTLLEGEILTPTSFITNTDPEATVGTIALATATKQIIHFQWPIKSLKLMARHLSD